MPRFEPGDIVRVPFPYTDGEAVQHRPAVVLAVVGRGFLLWVAMITSDRRRNWPDDIAIPDHAAAGLPVPSIIRSVKIATIEAERAERRGALDDVTRAAVLRAVREKLDPK
jgi:mRNA interferase MazF